jgi:hypothetical protein
MNLAPEVTIDLPNPALKHCNGFFFSRWLCGISVIIIKTMQSAIVALQHMKCFDWVLLGISPYYKKLYKG